MQLGVVLTLAALLIALGLAVLLDWLGVSTLLADRAARRQAGSSRLARVMNPRGKRTWRLTGAIALVLGVALGVFGLLYPPR
jgi:hypothetical protein